VAWLQASSALATRMALAAGELVVDLGLGGAGGLASPVREVGDEADKWSPPGSERSCGAGAASSFCNVSPC
jgi:hypothetical protein